MTLVNPQGIRGAKRLNIFHVIFDVHLGRTPGDEVREIAQHIDGGS